ncbi:hypothetical protein ACFO25_10405 [Paenactinomyces guangxiensis]|uniref:Uncharacterized protein n=1 Tax=Paenactinomyces guangxiensis TaxID=1490290 RepID=A0A7W2AAQ5_9BACL|nr:hypothetical protein [Paenactinomyces guangxiensis]MBA4496444.1 hypothetical protein [Paenactinomyces guangxiensis]MBH8593560.1 hypothetical protein [Paenactinomyces guangxiensis]
METRNVNINISGDVRSSQVGDNRNAKMTVNTATNRQDEKIEELKQQLTKLIQSIETTTEIDEETKDEYLMSLSGAKTEIENGKCSKGVLRGLNKTLTEFGGVVAGIAALGQAVSATTDVVETVLKTF